MQNFPALDSKGKAPAPKSARVLVIKGPKSKKTGKNVWDKVASAATVASGSTSNLVTSTSSSATTSARSSPQSSRPSSPVSKPVSKPKEEFPSLKKQSFPSLPKAPPKHQIVMNMRRNASGSSISNAWGSSGSSNDEEPVNTEPSQTKKKKGRKNNVLFRVGL